MEEEEEEKKEREELGLSHCACVGMHVRAHQGMSWGRGAKGRGSLLSGGDKSANKTQELLGARGQTHM